MKLGIPNFTGGNGKPCSVSHLKYVSKEPYNWNSKFQIIVCSFKQFNQSFLLTGHAFCFYVNNRNIKRFPLHLEKKELRSSHHGSAERNLTSIHEDADSIPGLTKWVKGCGIAMSCGVGHRHGSELMLLWLQCKPAAEALIGRLARESSYARCGPGKQKRKEKERKEGIEKNFQATNLNSCDFTILPAVFPSRSPIQQNKGIQF